MSDRLLRCAGVVVLLGAVWFAWWMGPHAPVGVVIIRIGGFLVAGALAWGGIYLVGWLEPSLRMGGRADEYVARASWHAIRKAGGPSDRQPGVGAVRRSW